MREEIYLYIQLLTLPNAHYYYLVDEMIAGRNLTRYSGRVDVLLADRAVGPGHTLHTFVFSFQVVGEAHVTTVTVEVVTTTSDLKL